jgi:hypothetical protein
MKRSGQQRMCGISGAAAGRGEAPIPAEGREAAGTGFRIRPFCPGHRRSLDFCLRMGHCAPAVAAALADDGDPIRDNAVLLASAMAGGIGNSGRECGALTSAVMYLGRHCGPGTAPDAGVPAVVLSRLMADRFGRVHGGLTCDNIRRGSTNPLPCMRAMVSAPEIAADVIRERGAADLPEPAARLLSAFGERPFHCAHGVLLGLSDILSTDDRLTDMTYPFVGGVALSGTTCSAAAAGVMAVGRATGRIEKSRLRVFMMMTKMAFGGDMMADDVNNFNPAINRGGLLMAWFAETFGGVTCRELTGIDIDDGKSVERYLSSGGIGRCESIVESVAAKAREIIEKA